MSATDDELNTQTTGSASRRRSSSAKPRDAQIDLSEALEAPVRVKREGGIAAIDPYEAMLRQHVGKSLMQRSVASMEFVLDEAEKHKLIKEPPPPPTGGVFIVQKNLPEEIERQIFGHPDHAEGERASLLQIMALLLTVIDFKRLMRCFNGRQD